jgi:hypothetical protein
MVNTINNDNNIEFSGANRRYYNGKVRLGKKINIVNMTPQLKRHIAMRGMSRVNLITEWDNVIGKIYSEHSLPSVIKNISGVKTLICKVRHTRIIEFQHEKELFIKQINLFAGFSLIDDIRFVRVDSLPKKRKVPIPIGLTVPNEPHPKLSDEVSQCQNIELQKSFHLLAHIIMPVHTEKKDSNHNEVIRENKNLLSSWRERAKIILNCPNK